VGLQGVAKGLSREPLEVATLRARVDGLLELLRSIHDVVQQRALGLRPAGLDDLGLAPALRSAGKRWSSGYGIPVLLDDDDAPAELPSSVEITLFRVAEEAVANAAQHGAPSRVELLLRQSEAGVELSVADDGRGFDVLCVGDRDLGLLAMRERLTLVGGQLRITSRPGAGTTVVAEVPLSRVRLAEPSAAIVEPLASPN
jgi:two-component system sensor histidine kinase UhpB